MKGNLLIVWRSDELVYLSCEYIFELTYYRKVRLSIWWDMNENLREKKLYIAFPNLFKIKKENYHIFLPNEDYFNTE